MADPARPPIVHQSVLLEETVAALNPRPGLRYVDGTLGGGGHFQALCAQLDATATVIGVDQDAGVLARTQDGLASVAPRTVFIHGNFGNLPDLLANADLLPIDGGIMLDLGMSNFQIKAPERGFSFQSDGPLDMRMDQTRPLTAETLVNTWSAQELADLFFTLADERLSRPLASRIVAERPFSSTRRLAQLAESVYRQKGFRESRIHPATRMFQALRMGVNAEVEVLSDFLAHISEITAPGARIAIISFHSVEDRLVKNAFRLASTDCICPPRQPACTCAHRATLKLIGKPIQASDAEIVCNPQARSARLRVAERLPVETR